MATEIESLLSEADDLIKDFSSPQSNKEIYESIAEKKAIKYGIDPVLFKALIEQESGWDPEAISSAGARGLAQLMPGTASDLGVDPDDPEQNLDGGARYLSQMFEKFGSEDLALAAYNAGPGAVQKYGDIPPFPETQQYVFGSPDGKNKGVLKRMKSYSVSTENLLAMADELLGGAKPDAKPPTQKTPPIEPLLAGSAKQKSPFQGAEPAEGGGFWIKPPEQKPLKDAGEARIVPGLTPGTETPVSQPTTPSELMEAGSRGEVLPEPPKFASLKKQEYQSIGKALDPDLTPEQQAERDFGKKEGEVKKTIRKIYDKFLNASRLAQTAAAVEGVIKGEEEPFLTETELAGKRYLERRAELETEKKSDQAQVRSERARTQEEIASIQSGKRSEAGASETFVDTEPPGGFPEIPVTELAAAKAGEVREDVAEAWEAMKKVPWRNVAGEFAGMLVEDGPIIIAGFGGIKKFKDAVKLAEKMGDWERALAKLPKTARTAMLEASKKNTASQSVKTALRKGFENLSRLPDEVAKAAEFSAEVGLFLTPEALKTGEAPSIEEVMATGAFVGGVKAAQKAFKKAQEILKNRKKYKIDEEFTPEEPVSTLRPEMEVRVQRTAIPETTVKPAPREPTRFNAEPAEGGGFWIKPPEQKPSKAPDPTIIEPKETPFIASLQESEIDALTGVANQGKFLAERDKLEAEIKNNDEMIILSLDGDDFGKVNKLVSRNAGDEVIQGLAHTLVSHFPNAKVFRQGGEEFVAVLPKTPPDGKIKSFLSAIPDNVKAGGQEITVSIGFGKTFNQADDMASQAKEAGKNRALILGGNGEKRYIKGRPVRNTLGKEGTLRETELGLSQLLEETNDPKLRASIEESIKEVRRQRSVLQKPQTGVSEKPETLPSGLRDAPEGRMGGANRTRTASRKRVHGKDTPKPKGKENKNIAGKTKSGRTNGPAKTDPAKAAQRALTLSRYNLAKAHLSRGGKKPTEAQIKDLARSAESIPVPKKRAGMPSHLQALRTESKKVADMLINTKGVDRLGKPEKEILAKDLPKEFELAGMKYKRVASKDPSVVKYNEVGDPFSKALEVPANKKIYIDEKVEMKGDKLFVGGREVFQPQAVYKPEVLKTYTDTRPTPKHEVAAQKEAVKELRMFESGGPSEKGVLPKGRGREFISSQMKKKKYVDLRGLPAETPDDVAAVGHTYWRSDKFETFRIVMVKDGKIASHNGVTSRMPGAVLIAPESSGGPARFASEIESRLKRIGADGFYSTHNHPSGNVRQSSADGAVTAYLKRRFGDKYKGSIVNNHGKYSFAEATHNPIANTYSVKQEEIKLEIKESKEPLKWKGESAGSSTETAEFVKKLTTPEDQIALVLTDAQNKVKAVTSVHKGNLKNQEQFNETLLNIQKQFGSTQVVATYFGKDSEKIAEMARPLVQGSVLVDFLYGTEASWSSLRDATKVVSKRNLKEKSFRVSEDDLGYKPGKEPKMGESSPELKHSEPVFSKQLRVKKSRTQSMFDWQKRQIEAASKTGLKGLGDKFIANFVQHEAPIAKHLMNSPEGRKALMAFQLSRGAGNWSKVLVSRAVKEVRKHVPKKADELLSNLLQAERTIEVEKLMRDQGRMSKFVDKGKKIEVQQGVYDEVPSQAEPVFKSPRGLGAKEMEKFIEEVKTEFPEIYPELRKGMEKFWKTGEEQIRSLHKEGLLSDEFTSYLLENHKHYAPRKFLEYLDPLKKRTDVYGKKITVGDSGVQSLKAGSEGALVNDWNFLMTEMISRAQGRIFRNRANKELANFARDIPDNPMGIVLEQPLKVKAGGEAVYGPLPKGMERVYFFEDGNRKSILLPDDIAHHWQTNDPQINHSMVKIIRGITLVPLLKLGATGVNPGFAFTNLTRDMMFTWFKQHEAYSVIAPIGLAQMMKEMISVLPDVVSRKGLVLKYLEHGGGMEFMTQQGYFVRPVAGVPLNEATKAIQTLQEVGGYLGNTSELLTRVALMKRLMGKGFSEYEAAYRARTNLDFAQGGAIAKAGDNFIPYLNAAIQGTRGTAQAFKSNPKKAMFKVAQIMGLSAMLAYWAKKKHEEAYAQISDHDKLTGWNIPLGIKIFDKNLGGYRHAYIKIPKDHGQAFFAQIGEQSLNMATGKQARWDLVLKSGKSALPMASMPPSLEALLTYGFNKDFYRNKDVWKGSEVSPKMERYPNTPFAYKFLGDKLNVSPVRTEAAKDKLFPKNLWTDGLNYGFEKSMELVDAKDREIVEQGMWEKLTKKPLLRRYLRLSYPRNLSMYEDLQKFAVETHDKNGNLKDEAVLKKEIKKAEADQNDVKQRNNNELFYELERFKITGDIGPLNKFLEKASNEEDSKRILKRAKAMMKKEEKLKEFVK